MKKIIFIFWVFIFYSCSGPSNDSSLKWEKEIMEAEQNFAELVEAEGLPKGFSTFAADSAVLMRNNKIFKGRATISKFYENVDNDKINLSWKPDFIDVSESGDMAYTYGKYLYITQDSTGSKIESTGIFHTVWKRQKDGSWKFVWD